MFNTNAGHLGQQNGHRKEGGSISFFEMPSKFLYMFHKCSTKHTMNPSYLRFLCSHIAYLWSNLKAYPKVVAYPISKELDLKTLLWEDCGFSSFNLFEQYAFFDEEGWKHLAQSVINIDKRKFNLFYEQLHVTFEEKVCHLTWHHFITIKIYFCFNKRLSIRKMYWHPLSCGCAF